MGDRVARLPLETRFARDRFNEGVLGEWYAHDFDDSRWGTKNTFLTWDQQDPPEDDKGHDYDGYGWYRAAFDVDKKFNGRPMRLYLGGLINEGWIWINGEYAGHVGHQIWWMNGPREMEVTQLVKPGRKNTIAIRVWNNAEIGGLRGSGFLYSPTAAGLMQEKAEADAKKAEEDARQAKLEEQKKAEEARKAKLEEQKTAATEKAASQTNPAQTAK
jgi:hypothetical protein